MQRKPPVDPVQRHVRAIGVHALMCFVDDEQIPVDLADLLQFVVFSPEKDRAFQILQRHKIDQPHGHGTIVCRFPLLPVFLIFLIGDNVFLSCDPVNRAHKEITRLAPDKTYIIRIPAVGDGRSVGNDQHAACPDPLHKVIDGQCLPETRLGIPEIFSTFMRLAICCGTRDSFLLFRPEDIRHHCLCLRKHPVIRTILMKHIAGVLRRDVEPFVPVRSVEVFIPFIRRLLDPVLPQICVKIMIGKGLSRSVIEYSIPLPFLMSLYACRMGLLPDACIDILLRIPDLDVPLMITDPRCRIGIDHGDNGSGRLNARLIHQIISLANFRFYNRPLVIRYIP